jgi:hypothetical protein
MVLHFLKNNALNEQHYMGLENRFLGSSLAGKRTQLFNKYF